jgi:hypothetical protein
MLMPAHNFPQATPDTIANNRAAKAPARNKADARRAGILHREDAEHHELAAFLVAGLLYTIELPSARYAPRFWERKRTGSSHLDYRSNNPQSRGRCLPYSKSLPLKHSREDSLQVNDALNYGEGAGDVTLMFVSVFVSVLVSGAGDSFTIVVSFFSAGGFVTVVSLCSQPASTAAPVRIRIYFLIMVEN